MIPLYQYSLLDSHSLGVATEHQCAVFFHAMLCTSAAYAVMRCWSGRPSVRLSVMFVDSVETNKHIFKLFHHRVATPL